MDIWKTLLTEKKLMRAPNGLIEELGLKPGDSVVVFRKTKNGVLVERG